MMKKLISILLAVLLIAAMSGTAFAETGIGVEPGQAMPDFTVSLTDGTTATLSELLKEKDLVVLNIFASWCGPCEREFPEMETVYQANSDRMVILSVSGDPGDTMEMISDYKVGHSLSFPMGLAGDALDFLTIPGFPTSIFIDRSGNVGFIKVGAFASQEEFEGKVNTFLSADYNGKPLTSEVAHSITPYLLGLLALNAFCGLFLIIGRWCLLRKAGKSGWHSLIPFLSTYKEYSICWNGWLGLLAELCTVAFFATGAVGLEGVVRYALPLVGFLIGIPESLKLTKAFGKGTFMGVLLCIPGLRGLGRFILGVSKAKYQGTVSEAEAVS
jgi:thiol-disulfide isomerase/thioredoxin